MAKKYIAISDDGKHQEERDLIEDVSLISQDTTTARAYEAIDTTTRPQFVEIYQDGDEKYCKYSIDIIHGVVTASTLRGGLATIILPSVKVKGFSGLIAGELYALIPSTREIVIWDEEDFSQLPIGLAASDTEIEFVDDWFKKRKQPMPVLGELWCGVGTVADGSEVVAGELWCGITVDEENPEPPVSSLSITDVEGPASSYSKTESAVTTSKKRPQIAFYGRLNGAILPNGSDIQYSIDGSNWYNCGKLANFKHLAEQPDSLPLRLNWATTYQLRIRLAINTAVVSNIVSVTTASEPSTDDSTNVRKIIWSFGGGLDRPRENGLWDRARACGTKVIAPFDIHHWSKYERGEGNYNFDELEYELEQHRAKGYQMLIWIKPQFDLPESGSTVTVHRKVLVGGVWNGQWTTIQYSGASASYLPSSTWERDRNGNHAAFVSLNFGSDGQFSYNSTYAVDRFMKLVARICHFLKTGTFAAGSPFAGESFSSVVHAVGLIDGGYNETSFNVQFRDRPGDYFEQTDLIYSDVTIEGFRVYLASKYGNIHALNAAWESNFSNFNQITRATAPKAYIAGADFYYQSNNGTKDIWEWKVWMCQNFYNEFVTAVKNPSAYVAGLTNDTDFLAFCYISENFSSGQGRTYGISPMRTMYSMFDGHLSSTTSGDGPVYFGESVLKDIAARMALLRGTFGGSHFGQEKDGDPVEYWIGYSRIYQTTLQYGGLYCCIALQLNPNEWDRPVFSFDGKQRSRADDLKYTYDTFINGVTPPTLPSLSSSVTYSERATIGNPQNPNNVLTNWKAAANPNNEGIAASLVGIDCIGDLGGIDLIIDNASIEFTDVSIGGGSSKQILFWATVNGKTINNGFAFDWTTNGTNWFQGGKFPGWKLTTNVTSAGYLSSGMTVNLQIRLTGATSVLSNTITGITIP